MLCMLLRYVQLLTVTKAGYQRNGADVVRNGGENPEQRQIEPDIQHKSLSYEPIAKTLNSVTTPESHLPVR